MEEQNASLEKLIDEIERPLWRAAAEARLGEIRAEVEGLCSEIEQMEAVNNTIARRAAGAELQVDELSKRIYKIGLLCDAVPGLQHGFCPDIGEPRDNVTRIKIALDGFIKKRKED
jgi:hypothetical protein